ncbi:MAG: protein-L-isoaspartate(D-aspartate) O-methyltransferase [Limnohabitans sp.]|nr:protein-L-isoaspartate(D-aspartate) O-methyltransferase [Limnohabitans sp.]
MTTFAERREAMVDVQLKRRGISDLRVLNALRTVPREKFVPARLQDLAYEDAPLPIEEGQTISQPYIVALMLQAAQITPSNRVLEVGAGSGYVAALLGQLAKDVYAIEWHAALAGLAKARIEAMDLEHVRVRQGDGTLGWSDAAPFDSIIVSAGGPEVPPTLLAQLAVGGRLVIPVGIEPKSQELLCITKSREHEYERASLGLVQFVPLVGSEGWSANGASVAPRRAQRPLRAGTRDTTRLSQLIAQSCETFQTIEHASLDGIMDRIGSARVVLLGESTHGTSEFYRFRARLTQALIARGGFKIVAIEADWPDTAAVDRVVRQRPATSLREPMFSRFPTWMWRNREMQSFIDWLARRNACLRDQSEQTSIHGLDIYSLNNSIGAVIDFLDRVDPFAAEQARERYACFTPWERDPQTYGRAVSSGLLPGCEAEAMSTLRSLLEERLRYAKNDGDAFFDAARNATVVSESERYYRAMYRGSRESWNLRDRHMFETLLALLEHRGPEAKAVIWAHNSHDGNAAATEMGMHGEWNIGQLVRERFGERAYSIGFGTDRGSVAAASNWDAPMQIMQIRPSHEDSYERVMHESGQSMFMLPLRHAQQLGLRQELMRPRLERAIGVIYRPETEMVSHYFQATLPAQFDEYVWFDETNAIEAIETPVLTALPDTYPFAL